MYQHITKGWTTCITLPIESAPSNSEHTKNVLNGGIGHAMFPQA